VRSLFGAVPGHIFNGTFVDYGATRNDIIDRANSTQPRPVFLLMMSADEQVNDIKNVASFLQTVRWATGPAHEAYGCTIGGGVDFETVRIGKPDYHWRYKGRVHEYWTNPKGEYRGRLKESVFYYVSLYCCLFGQPRLLYAKSTHLHSP
jgi:hypothetical protein